MSYIGREPQIGNFQMCDAISVVNNQASYSMQVGGVAVIAGGNFNVIASVNGVVQKAGSSFTISSSTITFSQNLVTGDVIDFILILGSVLDLGVPSDGTVTTGKIVDANVTTAKIADNAVTSAKLASGLAFGKIGQVVTATTSTEATNTSTSYADIGLSATITPTATSSKIYVIASVSILGTTGGSSNQNVTTQHRILRGSTQIVNYNTSRINLSSNYGDGGNASSLTVLDSPSSTSELTFKVQQRVETANSRSSISQFNSTASTITLMEVLA